MQWDVLIIDSYQVSMQNPVRMKIMDAIQDLIKQRLNHPFRNRNSLLLGFGCSMIFDDVLWEKMKKKKIQQFDTQSKAYTFLCSLRLTSWYIVHLATISNCKRHIKMVKFTPFLVLPQITWNL